MKQLSKRITKCRMCKNSYLKQVISLGKQPLANAFLTQRQLKKKEKTFPLKVNFCDKCGQLQLTHSVSPDLLFKDYLYLSSTSPVFIKHFKDYSTTIINKLQLPKKAFVIDVGSNDGILLKPFKDAGMRILGVDPAKKIAELATQNGLPTLPYYLNQKVAKKIVKHHGHADVITANNVFAHVPDIEELVLAVDALLKPEGVFIIEAPYLEDFLQKNLFDTIYHEHVSYLSINSLFALFKRFAMEIFYIEKVLSHGGSIRVYVKKNTSRRIVSPEVKKYMDKEKKVGLLKITTYTKFAKKIAKNKHLLKTLLNEIKSQKKNIAAYGAPAKGNTLLNYFRIGPETLSYIVDDSILKQGRFTPGMHIPVVSSDELSQNKPDYLLLLAWNFADPIMQRLSRQHTNGLRFIIPVPEPEIV